MSTWGWLAVAAAAAVGLYLCVLGTLMLAGRGELARALVRLVPDLVVLFRRLLADPRVPRRSKLLLALALGYLALPLDLVPDFVPVVGAVDDAVVVALVLRAVLRSAGPGVVQELWPGPRTSLDLVLRLAGAQPTGVASPSASRQPEK